MNLQMDQAPPRQVQIIALGRLDPQCAHCLLIMIRIVKLVIERSHYLHLMRLWNNYSVKLLVREEGDGES